MLTSFTGSVLNVETLRIKYEDTDPTCCVNTEKMCWLESGRSDRIFVTAIRVFYAIGKPAFETIGTYAFFFRDRIHDMIWNFVYVIYSKCQNSFFSSKTFTVKTCLRQRMCRVQTRI